MFVLFGILLLLIAVGIGVLFAMCAELANRVSSSGGGTGTTTTDYVLPVDRPDVYLRPDVAWPREFDGVRSLDALLLLVVSTSCASCNAVADELGDGWATRSAGRLGLVVSTADVSRGAAYVAQHGLADLPHFVDDGGDWTTRSLGLSLSPVGLIFIQGRLHGAYQFHQVESVWRKFIEEIALCAQSSKTEAPDSVAVDSSRPSASVAYQ